MAATPVEGLTVAELIEASIPLLGGIYGSIVGRRELAKLSARSVPGAVSPMKLFACRWAGPILLAVSVVYLVLGYLN